LLIHRHGFPQISQNTGTTKCQLNSVAFFSHGAYNTFVINNSKLKLILLSELKSGTHTLSPKKVDTLFWFGCNLRHLSQDENMASFFTDNILENGAVVVAADGAVFYDAFKTMCVGNSEHFEGQTASSRWRKT
jgi:hypothetical protein